MHAQTDRSELSRPVPVQSSHTVFPPITSQVLSQLAGQVGVGAKAIYK